MEGTANSPVVPRVLVAEDEPDIAALIAYQLTREGFRVETAGSGSEALDAIGRACYRGSPATRF
jgi:two-component system phosphate regulon response regulator PhoB